MKIYQDSVILYAIPVFVVSVLAEGWILHLQNRGKYPTKDAFASIGMGLGSAVINTFLKSIVLLSFFCLYQYRLLEIPFTFSGWFLCFLADDFSFYWHHRSCHGIRLFWAAHVNHHSSVNYNLAVALRQSWGELFHKYIWWMWLPIIGFHPVMILTMMSFSLIYQFFLHTEAVQHLGWFEYLFNTPSHHRVHHASNIEYLDKNHGGILIIWDRIFGTFSKEKNIPKPVFGITKNIQTYNLWEIATHEYRNLWRDVKQAKNWKERFCYIFMPPGWSPNGNSLTTKELQKTTIKL